jgi:peptide deformylase
MPRRLALFPDPVLRRRAEEIREIDDSVRELVRDLARLLREHRGAGIAAPQAGASVRLFLVAGATPEDPPQVFINPRLHDFGRESAAAVEGCLSLPEIEGQVTRPTALSVTAQDLEGREFTLTSNEFPARVWQHEIDHLDGVLIIDRMRSIDRLAHRRAIKALQAAGSDAAGSGAAGSGAG